MKGKRDAQMHSARSHRCLEEEFMLAIPVSLTHWFNTLSPQSVLFKFCINETDYSIGVILDVLVDSQKFTGDSKASVGCLRFRGART